MNFNKHFKPKNIVAAGLALALSIPSIATATTAGSVNLGEVIDFLNKEDKSNIEFIAAKKLKESLERNEEFLINGNQYVDIREYTDPNEYEIKSICAKVKAYNLQSKTSIDRDTTLKLKASSIDKPIILSSNVGAKTLFEGKIRVKIGTPYRSLSLKRRCSYKISGSTTKTIRASVTGNAKLALSLNINPSQRQLNTTTVRHTIKPTIDLVGNVTNISAPKFQVIGGGVSGKIISKLNDIAFDIMEKTVWDLSLEKLIVSKLADGEVQSSLEKKKKDFTEKVAKAVLGNGYQDWTYNQPIVRSFDLPPYSEEAFYALVDFIKDYEHRFPVSQEFLSNANVQNELYIALLTGDTEKIQQTLATSLACEGSLLLTKHLPVYPTPDAVDNMTHAEFCAQRIGETGKRSLGSASDVGESPWMLTPGTTFDIGVKSIEDNYQPYMKRVRYKSVRSQFEGHVTREKPCYGDPRSCGPRYETVAKYYGDGQCELEMRVYKKNTRATGLKPLMLIHGGSYKYRGAGFFGIESQVSHFTDRGFTVFAPFYRLVGSSDGNDECNRVDGRAIMEDAQDALAWIDNNKSRFGASGKVKLFGQSAGAHIAGYLSVHERSKIDKAWLMYPPLDLSDYLYNWTPSTNPTGTSAISGFLSFLDIQDNDLSSLKNSSHPFVKDNSLAEIVGDNPRGYPPLFLMHGNSDSLVPVEQSIIMCEALGGSGAYQGGDPARGSYRSTHTCGEAENNMHLFAQADHVMDLGCVVEGIDDSKLCPAGSKKSANAIKASFNDALAWITSDAAAPPPAWVRKNDTQASSSVISNSNSGGIPTGDCNTGDIHYQIRGFSGYSYNVTVWKCEIEN